MHNCKIRFKNNNSKTNKQTTPLKKKNKTKQNKTKTKQNKKQPPKQTKNNQ